MDALPPGRPPRGQGAPLSESEVLRRSLVPPPRTPRRRRRFHGRRLAALLLILVIAGVWAGRSFLKDLVVWKRPVLPERSAIEGLSALVALSAQWPEAKGPLFLEGLDGSDRALRREGERWELRWLRFLFLQGLSREGAAARDLEAIPEAIRGLLLGGAAAAIEGDGGAGSALWALAALGEVLAGRPGKAAERLGDSAEGARSLLEDIARAAALEELRDGLIDRLLLSEDPHLRLLGAAWGTAAGEAGARAALRSLPLEGVAAACMLVELGEEEVFLEKARPGRIDLAPLRLRVLKRRGDLKGARRLAQDLLASAPEAFDLRLEAARLAREAEDWDQALEHLAAAARIRPDSPEPMREWLFLGGECPHGAQVLLACADLFFHRVVAETRVLGLGEGPVLSGGPERLLVPAGFGLPATEAARSSALRALERAAARASQGPAPSFLLARVHFAEGRWAEAAEKFAVAEAAAEGSERAAIRPWRAASLHRAGRGAEALLEEMAPLELEGALARLARLYSGSWPGSGDPRRAAELLAARLDPLAGTQLLDEYARALEWSGEWGSAAAVLEEIVRREPGRAGSRSRAAWAWACARDAARAEAVLSAPGGRVSGGDPTPEEESAEAAMLRAFLAASREGPEAAEEWLGAAIRREPTDHRPWFIRGYFRLLSGEEAAAQRDWEEVLWIPAPALPAGPPEAALEPEALPWELALIHAARGQSEAARWYAPLGPGAGLTLPGSFFRAAALAAAGDWPGAEREALGYRDRGFPLEPWQALDPWVGVLFTGTSPAAEPSASAGR